MTTDVINQMDIMVATHGTNAAIVSGALPPLVPSVLAKGGAGQMAAPQAATEKTRPRKSGAARRPQPFRQAYKSGDTPSLLEALEQHAREKEGWERSMGATLALLKQAHDMIEQSEQVIFDQQNRIRQLEKVAITDELTGILNRRGFYDAFTGEIERCNRGLVKGGVLVVIDLDNFKNINDTHGHAAGDAALRLVARMLQNEIRAMDAAARLGGDEFVLLLSHATKLDATDRAQNIGCKLNNLSLAWNGHEIPVRASLGLKEFGAGDTVHKVFNAADAGLYQQKEIRKGCKEKAAAAEQAATVS